MYHTFGIKGRNILKQHETRGRRYTNPSPPPHRKRKSAVYRYFLGHAVSDIGAGINHVRQINVLLYCEKQNCKKMDTSGTRMLPVYQLDELGAPTRRYPGYFR